MEINKNILFILFTSDFYKCYYALNLASTYQACNKNVTIFFSGYACNFLKKDWDKYDKLKISEKVNKKKMTNYVNIFKLCSEINIKIYYCETAIDFLDITPNSFIKGITIKSMPLYQVINSHKNSQTIFI